MNRSNKWKVVRPTKIRRAKHPQGTRQPSTFNRPTNNKMQTNEFQIIADRLAQHMGDHYFDIRKDVFHVEAIDRLFVINNHPYALHPTMRPDEMRRIEERLKSIGIETLARGWGGEIIEGPDQRYTATLLLDCGNDRISEVRSIVEDESLQTYRFLQQISNEKNS